MSTKNSIPGSDSLNEYPQIEHFEFEGDFVEKNIGCIPMVVRFKLDAAGIKLNLPEWSRFGTKERVSLAVRFCSTDQQKNEYLNYVKSLVKKHTGHEATEMPIETNPAWTNLDSISTLLQEKAKEFGWEISLEKWRGLSDLQRFALMKLCRPGHENKNFPKAVKEFNMV